MFILDATTKSIEVKLAGAHATTAPVFVTSYVDVTTTTYTPGEQDGLLNGTTAVTAMSAPGASTQRQLKLLTVRNQDTAAATLTLQYNNNATIRPIWKGALAVDDTLVYTDGEGLRVIDSTGAIKGGGGSSGVPTSRLINTTAPLSGGGDLSADRTLTTSMATNKLIGRGTAATGVMEEITLGTNLSFTGTTLNAAGAGGATAQDIIDDAWDKKFFSDAGVLPATERTVASLSTCPTEGGTYGGTFTKVTGGGIWSAADNLTWWDFGGAAKDEVLAVLAGAQMGGGAQIGLTISPTQPTGVDPSADSFTAWIVSASDLYLNRNVYPNAVLKGTATGIRTDSPVGRSIGLAIYFKASTDVLKMFVRESGRWIIVVDTTDTTFAGCRYVAVHRKTNGVSRMLLPLAVWSS